MKKSNISAAAIAALTTISAASANVYADVMAEPESGFGAAGSFAVPVILAAAAAVVSAVIIIIVKKKNK